MSDDIDAANGKLADLDGFVGTRQPTKLVPGIDHGTKPHGLTGQRPERAPSTIATRAHASRCSVTFRARSVRISMMCSPRPFTPAETAARNAFHPSASV